MPAPEPRLDLRTTIPVALCSVAAMVFCTLLYKYTLRAWFQEDDFAWLGLTLDVHTWKDFLHAMFVPMAQGTIRPFSERAFYMGFSSLFGLNALPYRILVYVTQLANIGLLSAIAYRLMRSYAASFWAPVLWVANSALALPLTWTAAYNEILCSFVFLVSFYALLRYTQAGDWRFHLLQWVSFLFGFGVLEVNAIYPAIAILYVFLFAPAYVKRTCVLIIPSVLFSIIHLLVRMPPRNNIYQLHIDFSIAKTLATYWSRALGSSSAAENFPEVHFFPVLLTVLLSLAILGFATARAVRGDRLPVFCLGWFVIALAPFLPIRNHISDYYLTVPSVGLAMLGAWAIVVSLKQRWSYRVAAIAAVAIYLACSVPAARRASQYTWSRSMPVKRLVLGVMAAHERNPGKIILLEGVGEELFWNGVYDRPFRLFGADDVYLTPEAVQKIPPYPELGNVADYTVPEKTMFSGLAEDRVVVYGVETGSLRDITGLFKATMLNSSVPRRIELAHPQMESLLGASWYGPDVDFRWMPKQATVRLGVPANGEGVLRMEAFCAPVQIQSGPLAVWAVVEGKKSAPVEIRSCDQAVRLNVPVTVASGAKEVHVTIEVDRTIRIPTDHRDLGLGVRSIEIVDRP